MAERKEMFKFIRKISRLRSKIVHGKAHLLTGEDTGKTEPAANKKNNLSRHKSLQKGEIKGNAISLVCLLAMLVLVGYTLFGGMLPANQSGVTKNLVVVLPHTSEPAKSNLQPYPFDGITVTPMPPSSLPKIPPPLPTQPLSPQGNRLATKGDHIVDSRGNIVVLRGVTRWSLEFNCGDGHFNLSDFQAIRSWGANAVRITLNSNFWLNGYPNNCTSSAYQTTVKQAVANAEAAGLRPILVLQWAGNKLNGGRGGQMNMPPRPEALTFWQQVASLYASDPYVMFSLFSEPHNTPSWDGWLNGFSDTDGPHAGMQEMANVVEQAAPGHIIFVSGEAYAKNLDFVTNGHMVQGANIVLEVHPYGYFSSYSNQWQGIQPNYPIVDGELGLDSSGDTVDTQLQTFENWQTGYFGWAWTDVDNHSLLNSGGWNGDPRSDPPQFGVQVHNFMLSASQKNGGFITSTVTNF